MREDLQGYDTSYRYGQNPKIDEAIKRLNEITMPFGGGIAFLDENENVVQRYTDKVVLELPDSTPKEIINKARRAVTDVLSAMGVPKKGLGAEKNKRIAELLLSGNSTELLQMIQSEDDKDTACEVVINSMFEFNNNGRANSVNNLITTALSKVDEFADTLKALILYSWRNHLQGERFWKNPNNGETLFVDDDGEVISFKGEIGTFTDGQSKGMNYIKVLNEYTVLTGTNKGKVFNGGYNAKGQENYRPIKGPNM